jgi:type IV secretory pathway VirJ component
MRLRIGLLLVTLVTGASVCQTAWASTTDVLLMRGRPQVVHLYGTRGAGAPMIVSSGDGGWMHLGPQVASYLASQGYFVVGFDAKAYLKSFTSNTATLQVSDVPADFRELLRYAARDSAVRPVLIGVSEGAGLSVLAASDPQTKPQVGGVIALGLPDMNELGWRWKDSWIYVTHGVPNEPMFSSAALVGRVAPVPLAAIHSTRDEFVPLTEIQHTMARAADPKQLWTIAAADHRFSDNLPELNQRLIDALNWISRTHPR